MAQDVEVINIDTGNSVQTIKSLKEEIKNLRNELENCEVGSEEFHSTLNQLTNAQNQLKNATKTTASENEALAGSYNALNEELNKLKKEWKATADEAERADIGGQIAEINQKLKDMDAEIGNYQRNVGNYGSAFDDLSIKVGDSGLTFERLNQTSQDVIGSFDVLEGGLKAVGIESSAVTGLMDKLQGAMKMTQGFKSIKEGQKSFQMLKIATNGATVATNGFKKALIATGIGALVVAVGTLIAYWDDLRRAFGNSEDEIRNVKGVVDDLKTSLQNFDEDNNFLIRMAEAAGKTKEEILQLRLEQAKLAYEQSQAARDVADTNLKKAKEENWDLFGDGKKLKAAKEAYDEIVKIEQERWAELKKVYDDIAVYEQEQRTKAAEDEKKRNEEARKTAADAYKKQKEEAKAKAEEEKKTAEAIEERARKAVITTKQEELVELKKIYEEELKLLQKHKISTYNLTEEFLDKETKLLRESEKIEGNEQEQLAAIDKFYKERLKIYTEYGISTVELTAQFEAEKNAIIQNFETKNQTKALNDLKQGISASQSDSTVKQSDIESKYVNESLALPEDAAVKAIELEIAKTIELQDVRRKAFDEQMAQMQAVLDSGVLTAEQQAELQAEYNALQQEKIQSTQEANDQISVLNKQLLLQQKEDNKQLASNITASFTAALDGANQILSAVLDNMDEESDDYFEKSKKIQIAQATIQMLTGIVNAITTSMALPQPWGAIQAGINAAVVATTGAIQIDKIKKTRPDGGGGINENFNMPSINTSALLSTPINYTSEVQGAQAIEDIPDTRVYVVESDITDTVKKVQVAEEESTY